MIILILDMGKIEVQIGKPRSHHQLVMELQIHGAVWYGPLPSTNLQDTSLFLIELLLHLLSPLRRSKTLLTSHQSQVYGLMPSILPWSGHSDARNAKRIPQKLDNYHIKEFISTVTLSHPFFRVFFNQTIFIKCNISYFLKYSLWFFFFWFTFLVHIVHFFLEFLDFSFFF